MGARALDIEGLFVLEPKSFADDRGAFFESYNAREFADVTGLDIDFVQDNQSLSRKGVVRGLHYQAPPHGQGKLVRVVTGSVFDVAVDLRRSSPTFGRWAGLELSAQNRLQFWIPAGFAHGFVALEENTTFLYKVTTFRVAESERTIRWDDSSIGIAWPPFGMPILSAKDASGGSLADAELFD